MDLIRTGIDITKTIKNVSRLREILTIFARNGFDEFIQSSGVLKFLPNFVLPSSKQEMKRKLSTAGHAEIPQMIGIRLRQAFEELGPSFVKLGQLFCSREDMFPSAFIQELKLLQDQVKGLDFSIVKNEIESSLGQKIGDVFLSLDEHPIGTASIGVVHRGVLKSGEEIVVKVRRPNIRSIIEADFDIITYLVEQLEKVSAEIKYLGISRLLRDFAKTMSVELDLNIEARNRERLWENIHKHDKTEIFLLPKIYHEYNRENMIVMEFFDGIPFSNTQKIKPYLPILEDKLTSGLEVFIKNIIQDGFFHADLHGGNFFYLNKIDKIGILDFGLVGSMSKKSRMHFLAIIYSIVSHNFENLVFEFLNVAEYESIPDVDLLTNDIKDAISPFIGMTVQKINFPLLMRSIITTLRVHKLYLPRDWYIVFRGLAAMDGVGKSLGMDFDIYKIVEKDMNKMLKSFTSKDDLMEEGIWVARDLIESLRIVPRHLKWFLKDISKKNYAVEIRLTGYEKSFIKIFSSVVFLSFSLLSAVFIFSGLFFIEDKQNISFSGLPTITLVFWTIGLAIILRGLWIIRRK